MSGSCDPTKRRVVLHIGTAKTGTSSIQMFLVRNAEALAAQGILVPASPLSGLRGAQSHRKLAAYALGARRGAKSRELLDIEDLPRFRDAFAKEFVEECESSSAPVIALSSEHLSSRVDRTKEIVRLKNLLDPIGQTTVVVYLRRQEDYLVSAYSTAVRLGSTEPLRLPGPRITRSRFDYRAMCERWADAFGRDNVKVAIFEPRQYSEPRDLLLDFARTAGLALDLDRLEIPPRENQGLDWRLLEFLRRFNAAAPRGAARSAPHRGRLLKLLAQLPRCERATLPQAELRAFAESFAEGNAFVARHFLGREDGILFRPGKRGRVSAYTDDMPIDVAFELFGILWAEIQEEGAGASLLEKLKWPHG